MWPTEWRANPSRRSSWLLFETQVGHQSREDPLLICDLKCCFRATARVRANPQSDSGGLDTEFILLVPESKSFSSYRERYFFRLAGSERNSLKPAQRPNRLRNTCSAQLHIELNSFVSHSCSRVCDFSAHGHRCARGALANVKIIIQGLCAELRFVNQEISVPEFRIREPIPEWKLRAVLFVDVP